MEAIIYRPKSTGRTEWPRVEQLPWAVDDCSMEHAIDRSMEHSIEQSMEHSMEDSIERSIEHSMEHFFGTHRMAPSRPVARSCRVMAHISLRPKRNSIKWSSRACARACMRACVDVPEIVAHFYYYFCTQGLFIGRYFSPHRGVLTGLGIIYTISCRRILVMDCHLSPQLPASGKGPQSML